MKNFNMKTLVLTLTAMFALSAQAELKKTATKVNFNEMIESSQKQQTQLQEEMAGHYEGEPANNSRSAIERQRVVEFLDAEMGHHKSGSVVGVDDSLLQPLDE